MDTINEFVACKNWLKVNGFSFGHWRKGINILKKIVDSGFNKKRLVESLENEQSLFDQSKHYERRCLQAIQLRVQIVQSTAKIKQFWGVHNYEIMKDWVELKVNLRLTAEEILSVVKCLRHHYPNITPAGLCKMIEQFSNMKAAMLGISGNLPDPD